MVTLSKSSLQVCVQLGLVIDALLKGVALVYVAPVLAPPRKPRLKLLLRRQLRVESAQGKMEEASDRPRPTMGLSFSSVYPSSGSF